MCKQVDVRCREALKCRTKLETNVLILMRKTTFNYGDEKLQNVIRMEMRCRTFVI